MVVLYSTNKPRLRVCVSLLEIIDKYGVLISQWIWLYQALLEVSMNKIALWLNFSADDWTAKRTTIASNMSEYHFWYLLTNMHETLSHQHWRSWLNTTVSWTKAKTICGYIVLLKSASVINQASNKPLASMFTIVIFMNKADILKGRSPCST